MFLSSKNFILIRLRFIACISLQAFLLLAGCAMSLDYWKGQKKSKLISIKEKLKLGNVTFVPIQDSNIMPEIWASADIGIISLKKHITGAVPSKLYEVMSSETPIIFIGDGEAKNIVESSKCGLVLE